MKALSLWQPWASLVVRGMKRFETRSWSTAYRGTLAIHASKATQQVGRDLFAEIHDPRFWGEFEELPFGAIIGTVELVAVRPAEEVQKELLASPERPIELDFGDFSPGRYAWELREALVLVEPIEQRGAQGLFEVPYELGPPEAPRG